MSRRVETPGAIMAPRNDLAAARPAILSLTKLLLFAIANLPFLRAAPTRSFMTILADEEDGKPAEDPTLWIYLAVAVGLVLLGGAFAGLTIALMGQDEIYLQVIRTSGEGAEKKRAAKVLRLLNRGKHWVLVTLLLGNVITNETLPIVLDRSLGGGWPAVLGSTVLIVIFGEIIPQSICVRYGLPIGAWMSPLVLVLMYLLAPVAWPTAKLLDRILGKDHGTVYKKAGLKTLVTLHKTLGAAGEQLNSDEVTIISAVLDLKEKPVGSIMTPMEDVLTMSADTLLDEKTMDRILSAGYSRIPIHAPDNPENFVGMLLVKMLITYDPEDSKPVRDFALATLPETRAETSCLDIVNFFQEGKSHMVLVSEYPGEDEGALGVVTLEDVIEELIGEEIIDESDVFVDIHKAIRRMAPAPRTRVPKGTVVTDAQKDADKSEGQLINHDHGEEEPQHNVLRRMASEDKSPWRKTTTLELSSSPKTTFLIRRASGNSGINDVGLAPKRSDASDIMEHLKHLGPSNLASRPRTTRYNTVKIKPGVPKIPENTAKNFSSQPMAIVGGGKPTGIIGEGLVGSAGRLAKDGVHALQVGYGSIDRPRTSRSSQANGDPESIGEGHSKQPVSSHKSSESSSRSNSTVGSLPEREDGRRRRTRTARSGSITENVIETGGIKKVVLETNSGSDETAQELVIQHESSNQGDKKASKKKRRRKRRKDGHGARSESTPLLSGEE